MNAITPNQRRRLRFVLIVVFSLLLVPAATLAYLGYRQLQFESFYQHQAVAAELTRRIDRQASSLFAVEDGRSFVDFGFLVVGEGEYVQRSPLSRYPVQGNLPGLVSYFQVDADGMFSTPMLPKRYAELPNDIEPYEYQQRLTLQDRVRQLLARLSPLPDGKTDAAEEETGKKETSSVDELSSIAQEAELASSSVAAFSPAENTNYRQQTERVEGQAVFERLNAPQAKAVGALGNVAELKLKERYQNEEDAQQVSVAGRRDEDQMRARRLEKNVEPAAADSPIADFVGTPLTTFESEVDPFRFDVVDEDHFVLYRNVWRDQQRIIQGAVIERSALLEGLVGVLYRGTGLSDITNLTVALQGDLLHTYFGGSTAGYLSRADEITGTLLYQTRLTAPLNDLELIFSFTQLPLGPGGALIGWTTFVFIVLLVGGFATLYRLGLHQISLSEQQQDFVSAVSHELKTPLTSIRMYGEILKAGWATEDKKRSYYDFIFTESERLTRLINNVLRLARINHNGTDLELRTTTVGELVDITRSKITTHVEQAGFELVESHDAPETNVAVDGDAFVQIMINLVDNALKFCAKANQRQIVFSSRVRNSSTIEFSVRDYGPGVPKDQMEKIFKLFYRTERELTRETVGTGIGLALVHELATAMGGSVDVRNAEPGAEFRVSLPLIAE